MPSWGNRSRTNARAFEKFTPVSRATARGSYHGTPSAGFLARKSPCCSAFPGLVRRVSKSGQTSAPDVRSRTPATANQRRCAWRASCIRPAP